VAPQVHRAASGDSAARKDVQPAKQPEAAKIERLNVAAIGTGGRGSTIAHQAARLANMVACCDVDGKRAEAFASRYGSHCRVYSDYRHVLDRKDVHAITIGTPDHWHAKIAIEAMRAGKDVYCEKPLTLTIDEGKQICRTVEQTHRVFQVGTQLRSEFGTFFLQAAALARSGRLGQHLKATASVGVSKRGGPFATAKPPATLDWDFWLGQAPRVDYCPERTHFDFRWWLEYSGGQVTDWGVHYVDIAMWALGLENTGPIEIVGRGDFPKVRNGFNVATTFDCTMHFANGSTIVLDSKKNNLLIEGEKGAISVNHRQIAGKPLEGMSKKDKQWLAEQVVKLYRGKQPGTHMGDFFDCIKSRALPISDVFTHHRAVSACHLCNLAMRLRRALRWDPAKQDFPGDAEASSMLSRAQRQPYSIQG
jgi:predicted dehydrogenase